MLLFVYNTDLARHGMPASYPLTTDVSRIFMCTRRCLGCWLDHSKRAALLPVRATGSCCQMPAPIRHHFQWSRTSDMAESKTTLGRSFLQAAPSLNRGVPALKGGTLVPSLHYLDNKVGVITQRLIPGVLRLSCDENVIPGLG